MVSTEQYYLEVDKKELTGALRQITRFKKRVTIGRTERCLGISKCRGILGRRQPPKDPGKFGLLILASDR